MEDKQLYAIIMQLQQEVFLLKDRLSRLEQNKVTVQSLNNNYNSVIKEKKVPLPHLNESDLVLFNNLRLWRVGVSKTKGIPLHHVASNRTLNELSSNKPRNKIDAMKCHGVGQMFVDSYWMDISKIIENHHQQ